MVTFLDDGEKKIDLVKAQAQSQAVEIDEIFRALDDIKATMRAKRLELKKALVDPNGTDESREAARLGLQKLPRNASPVRVRGRDSIDGRPRGFLSQFGVSRVRFRDMAHRGELPGITKSSW